MTALPTNVRVAAEEESPQSGSRVEETEGRHTRRDRDLLAGASLTQKIIAGIRTSQPGHTVFDSSRQAPTGYSTRDKFGPLSPSRTLSLDPETRDSLAETIGALHVSDDHYTRSPTAAPATRDWQPSTVSARHEETAFLSSDLNPSPQIYPSHDHYDQQPLPAAQTQQHGPNRIGTSDSSERIDSSYEPTHENLRNLYFRAMYDRNNVGMTPRARAESLFDFGAALDSYPAFVPPVIVATFKSDYYHTYLKLTRDPGSPLLPPCMASRQHHRHCAARLATLGCKANHQRTILPAPSMNLHRCPILPSQTLTERTRLSILGPVVTSRLPCIPKPSMLAPQWQPPPMA